MNGRRMVLALALLSAPGCAGAGLGMGTIGEVLGGMGGVGGMGGEVRGQVDWVDTRRRELELTSGYGQRTRLTFDSRTRVVQGGRRYPVSAIGSGDRISARVQREQRGELYAEQIYLESSRRDDRDPRRDDRGGWEARVERLDGRVGRVDTQRGRFELRASRVTYLVTLPYRPGDSTAQRFRRLRTGQSVRIDARHLGGGRVELVRFR